MGCHICWLFTQKHQQFRFPWTVDVSTVFCSRLQNPSGHEMMESSHYFMKGQLLVIDPGWTFCFEYAKLAGLCHKSHRVCINCWLCLFSCLQEAETGIVPSVQDFDKKLAEADAYLQILIDQLKVGWSVRAGRFYFWQRCDNLSWTLYIRLRNQYVPFYRFLIQLEYLWPSKVSWMITLFHK